MTAKFITRKLSKTKTRTLGSILKSARAKAGYSLEQAEQKTKICHRYLKALEEGSYDHLPSEAYNVGYIRSYAQFLKLDQEKIVGLYKNERSDVRLNVPKTKFAPLRISDWHFLITPKILGSIVGVVLLAALGIYIGSALKKFTQPPVISISSIPSGYVSKLDSVQVAGRTDSGAVVYMNQEAVATDKEGNFAQDVKLTPGVNQIEVTAHNRADREAKTVVNVLYQPADLAKLDISGIQ